MVVDFEEGLADRVIDRDAFPDDEVVVEGEGQDDENDDDVGDDDDDGDEYWGRGDMAVCVTEVLRERLGDPGLLKGKPIRKDGS